MIDELAFVHRADTGDLLYGITGSGEVVLGDNVDVHAAAHLFAFVLPDIPPPPDTVIRSYLLVAVGDTRGHAVTVTGRHDPRGPGIVTWRPGREGSATSRAFWAETARLAAG